MGIPVLVLGESGSGKSASLRNFRDNEAGFFNVASKPLPFRNQWPMAITSDYGVIIKRLQERRPGDYRFVIDDSQYLMAFESFRRANDKGYEKFTEMAVHFYNLVQAAINTGPNTLVYFLHHTEISDFGKTKAKTIGKMLDQQLTLEGLFSIVLLCRTDGQRHWFETQSDGSTAVKTPMGMFSGQIDNDLKFVDTTIRDFYGLEPLKSARQESGEMNRAAAGGESGTSDKSSEAAWEK